MGNLTSDAAMVAGLYEQCARMQPDVLLAWQGLLSWSDKHGLDATQALLQLNRLQPNNAEISKRLANLETDDPKILRRLVNVIPNAKSRLLKVLEAEEATRIAEEVEKRRNRLGAPPLAQLKQEVEQEIIGTGSGEVEELLAADPASLIHRMRLKLEWQVRSGMPTCADELVKLCRDHPDLPQARSILAEISDELCAEEDPFSMNVARSMLVAESFTELLKKIQVCEGLLDAAHARWGVEYPKLKALLNEWRVKALVSLGRYREAIPLLPTGDSLLIECYEQTGEFDRALELVSETDLLRRAWLLVKMGHWQEARRAYEGCADDVLAALSLIRLDWMEHCSVDREAIVNLTSRLDGTLLSIAFEYLGHSYFQTEDLKRASRCYQKALGLDASNAAAAIGLVRSLHGLGEDCKPLTGLLESLTAEHPRLASAWHLLACVQPDRAIGHLQSALKANGDWLSDSFDPSLSRSWPHWPLHFEGERLLLHLLADAYGRDGRLVAARRVYLRLMQEPEGPGCTERAARMGLARVEAELGLFEEALSRLPDDKLALDIRLSWLRQRAREEGMTVEVLQMVGELVKDAHAAEEWWVIAECATISKVELEGFPVEEGIREAVEEMLQEDVGLRVKALSWLACLQQRPTVAAWSNLATCLLVNDNDEVHQWAWECAQQACLLDPKDWRGWEAAGLVALSRAKSNVQWASLGQHCFCKALSLEGYQPRVWIHLATLYARLGDAELAQECLDKSVMMDPDQACHWMAKAAMDPDRSLSWLQQAMEAPDAGIVPDAVVERWAWLSLEQHYATADAYELNHLLSLFRLNERIVKFKTLSEMLQEILGLHPTNDPSTTSVGDVLDACTSAHLAENAKDLEELLSLVERAPGWPHLWHTVIRWRESHSDSADRILQWLEERLPGWGRLRPIGAEQTGWILETLVGRKPVDEGVFLSKVENDEASELDEDDE